MLTYTQKQNYFDGIGSGVVADILGMGYRTPLEVYMDFTGGREGFNGNDATRRGNITEAVVAAFYADAHPDCEVVEVDTIRHPTLPWLKANLDRVVRSPRGDYVLECKWSGLDGVRNQELSDLNPGKVFGESGTDEVPHYIILQVQHQMAVANLTMLPAVVATAIYGYRTIDDREYPIPFDHDLYWNFMYPRLNHFWNYHLAKRIPPDPTNTADYVLRWPEDNGETIVATPEDVEAYAEISALNDRIKADGKVKAELEGGVKKRMKEVAVMETVTGKKLFTFKTGADGVRRFLRK